MRHRAGSGTPPEVDGGARRLDESARPVDAGAWWLDEGARERGGSERRLSAGEGDFGVDEGDVDAPKGGFDAVVTSARGVEPPVRSARVRLGVGAVVVLLVGALVVAVAVSAFAQRGTEVPLAPATSFSTSNPFEASSAPGVELLVHVLGAVRTPGLVSLSTGSRVVDAVGAAGGLTEDADPGGINLARPVADGEQLYVPRTGEAVAQGAPGGSAVGGSAANGAAPGGGAGAGAGGKVDLNRAAVPELETLPRIGPALAQRIIDWRETNGRFTAVADLRKVTGIGEKLFDGLKDLVTV